MTNPAAHRPLTLAPALRALRGQPRKPVRELDTELSALLDVGDRRGAAALLVSSHGDAVYGLCRAMVRDGSLAEDLSQDVFGRAFASLEGFRGEASSKTWLLRIARNRCIDHLRAQQRTPLEFSDEPGDPASEEPSITDLLVKREALEDALASLGSNERALVVLRFGHELAYRDLASTFGLGEGAVRMRISRAVAKMREALEEPPARMRGSAPRMEEAARAALTDALPERLLATTIEEDLDEASSTEAPPAAAPSRSFGSGGGLPPAPGAPPASPAARPADGASADEELVEEVAPARKGWGGFRLPRIFGGRQKKARAVGTISAPTNPLRAELPRGLRDRLLALVD